MKDISPGIKRISEKAACSERVVQRFFRNNRNIASVHFRMIRPKFNQTNIYYLKKEYFEAMRFLDCQGLISDGKKKLKKWIRRLYSDPPPHSENVTRGMRETSLNASLSFKERVAPQSEAEQAQSPYIAAGSGFGVKTIAYNPFETLLTRYSPSSCEIMTRLLMHASDEAMKSIEVFEAKGQRIHSKRALFQKLLPRKLKLACCRSLKI
ncbi:MAG: hypothetical protein JSR93_03795 [Verrucomicrobia bacterium]|nr:hypothetical protein [Verrucomicrobiota bacterium]